MPIFRAANFLSKLGIEHARFEAEIDVLVDDRVPIFTFNSGASAVRLQHLIQNNIFIVVLVLLHVIGQFCESLGITNHLYVRVVSQRFDLFGARRAISDRDSLVDIGN